MILFDNLNKSFGLDISDLTLRMVELKKRARGLDLQSFGEIILPEGLIQEGEIIDPQESAKYLKKLIKSPSFGKITTKNTVACLPERKSFIKVIPFGKDSSSIDENEIRRLITKHIPFSLEEVYLDWQETDDGNILVAATPKNIVDAYTQFIEAAGLRPTILEVESQSIARCLLNKKSKSKGPVLIVEIGLNRSSLIIYDKGLVQFTSSILTFTGNTLTQKIAKKLDIKVDKAEKAKIICGFDDRIGKGVIKKILTPELKELISKIEKTIFFYQHSPLKQKKIEKIILSGGVSQTKNLGTLIGNLLGIKVEIGDPYINLTRLKSSSKIPRNKKTSFPTALGLALR